MPFTEDARVKIPAILHLTRLGYGCLSLKHATWDAATNIFPDLFHTSVAAINPGASADDIGRLLQEISLLLENEDLGKTRQPQYGGASMRVDLPAALVLWMLTTGSRRPRGTGWRCRSCRSGNPASLSIRIHDNKVVAPYRAQVSPNSIPTRIGGFGPPGQCGL